MRRPGPPSSKRCPPNRDGARCARTIPRRLRSTLLTGIEQDEIVHDHSILLVAQTVHELRGIGAAAADDATLIPTRCNVLSEHAREPEPIVLALDGGSTKTDAVLVAADGTLLGRSRVGPSNHQLVGLDGAMDAVGAADRRGHRIRRHQ